MNYTNLLTAVEEYVEAYFHAHHNEKLVYHNLDHTKAVVKATMQIANHYQLNEEDFFIVTTAAWFHDTGYLKDIKHHEQKGADLAVQFLKDHQVGKPIYDKVAKGIIATKMPQRPENQLERILCDGDLFHLGTSDFEHRRKLMRQEMENVHHKLFGKGECRKGDIDFLENHHYHTDYCAVLLDDQKLKNIEKLKKKVEKQQVQLIPEPEKLRSKSDKKRPDKGIETLFRITSANNQRLSDMADNKAQLLITVNSIILSLIVSLVLRRLEDNAFLVIPTLILVIVSLSTIIFSILATRPSIPEGEFTANDLATKKVNLLFFGNFYKMNLSDYTHGMIKVMNDNEFLYGTLINDVYSQGVVLGRKYKLIRIAYNIFMFGLIAAVLAYIISYIAYGKLD